MMKDTYENIRNKLTDHSAKELSQQAFDKLSKCCFMNLISEENTLQSIEQIVQQIPDQKESIYELFNLLMIFTVEALSKNLTDSELLSSLTDQGWSQQQAESYLKKFRQFRYGLIMHQVRDFIEDPDNAVVASRYQSKIPFNKMVDVDWKQEIVVSSKYANKIYQEIYKMNIHLKDPNAKDLTIVFKQINNKLGVLVKNVENSSDLKHFQQEAQ